MSMRWERLSPIGDKECATDGCPHSARWYAEAGDVGSYYCSLCKDGVVDLELRQAAEAVAIVLTATMTIKRRSDAFDLH